MNFGIAALFALTIMLVFGHRFSIKKFKKSTLAWFALTFPVAGILFTLSVFNASVALAVFSFYGANLVAQFVLGRMLFGERVDVFKKWAFVCTFAALLLFTNPFQDFTISLGLLYGIASGVVQGVASAFQKRLSDSGDRISLLVVQAGAGAILAGAILLFMGETLLPGLSAFNWFVAGVLGAIMLAIMYLFLVGYKYTNLNVGSVLVSTDLIFAPIFAYLLLGEIANANVLVGGILTAAAAVLANWPARKWGK